MVDLQPRAISRRLEAALRAIPVVVLTGPRQVGKSSLVRSSTVLRDHLLLDLDDPALRIDAERDPDAFVRRSPLVAIDEVQRVPELLLAVKMAVDEERQATRGRFVLTGSANLLAMRQVADSLAGRATYLVMSPMTRRELLGLGSPGIWAGFWDTAFDDWRERVMSESALAADWRETARHGGFPVAARLDDAGRQEWFAGYVATYLERDLRDVSAIESLSDFRRAMQAFALRAGSPVNHADIARELGLVARTLRRWLDLLDITNQIVELPAYAVRRSARVRKRAKYYWNDSALAMHVAGASQPEGVHLETLVLNDLRVWAASDPSRPTAHFWRDEAQREVDFVVERQGRLLPVEVKSTAHPHSDDWKHLSYFVREFGDRCVGGLLLHGGEQTFRASDGVLAVPWWRVI